MEIFELQPMPAPTHKTKGIDKSDWRRLFKTGEALLFRESVKNVDGDLSFLPNGAIVDLESNIIVDGINLTWRQILQLSFDEWNDAKTINADDPRTVLSTNAMAAVGILESQERVNEILKGVPL